MTAEKQRLTFISYARDDKDFALELAKELRAAGFLIWLDQLDIPTGSRWDDEVQSALERCEIFMVILTPDSTASNNVKDEIGYALDSNKRILPVLLENANIPFRLRRFQYVDFTHKSYKEGIEVAEQLLRRLLDEPTAPSAAIPVEARPHQARAEGERAAPQDSDADRLARQRAEAARLARARQQMQPQPQQVVPIPQVIHRPGAQQTGSKPAPKFMPVLLGMSVMALLCLGGGYIAYSLLVDNETVTPAVIVTGETLPVPIAVTTEAPPEIIPTVFPQEPDQFVYFYWETIIYDKNYELAWSLLTDGFKQRNNPAGFDDWKNTMAKLVKWDRPTSFDIDQISPSMVALHIDSIHFYSVADPDSGYFLDNINYCLIRDQSRNTWMLEYSAACTG